MNIRDFASICGCTHTTVSCAFSRPEKVRKETRERIMRLAEEHNFRPNRAGGASFNGVTKTIGVLTLPSVSYFCDITYGIQEELVMNGYLPISLTTNWDNRLELVRRLVDQCVDGVIMVDPRRELSPQEVCEFQTRGIPCVYVEPADTENDWVNTDDFAGGVMAAEHFLNLKHERLAVFRSIVMEKEGIIPLRTQGFADRLGKENLAPLHIHGAAELKTAIASKMRPTAVFLEVDYAAPELYDAAREAGLAIPEDLSVVGFADLDFCDKLRPALTSVRQDGHAVGRKAVELMLRRLKNRDAPPSNALIPVRLTERASTTQAPKTLKTGVSDYDE